MASSQEDAKNLALLFFMDHLMQKSGERTIHDLSCQFGARGFTAEMREAVGGTQEGLCDFLRQYPSLFAIQSDTVTLNGYGEFALGGFRATPILQNFTRDRDIEREAVEFFEIKLKKFGPELQIKSLLGHRSQAAPEIRLYSGRHVKDFTEFLQTHADIFAVDNDRVRLRNMPEPSDPMLDLDETGQPLTGQRAKQAAIEYIRLIVDTQEQPVPMEILYKQFCTRFSHLVRQEVATNPKELLQFLKLNRHMFFIRSNKVSIVKKDGSSEDGEISNSPAFSVEAGNFSPDQLVGDVLEVTSVSRTLKSAQESMQEVANIFTDPRTTVQMELSNVVAMDFKLVNMADGQEFLALITLGTPFGKLYVFDVANSSSILRESGLKDLLEAEDYIKVIHDCKRISTLLWHQYQISVQSVFDTQVANIVLQHQRTGRPLHEIRSISFLTLQRLYCPQSLMLTEDAPKKAQKRDPKFWSLRPLTDEMIRIAVEEIRALVPSIYLAMNGAMRPEFLELFWHLCKENADFFIKPQEVQIQRQERRHKYAMNIINEKLLHDPTGSTLTSREKKILATVEQDENYYPADQQIIYPNQDYIVPWFEDVIDQSIPYVVPQVTTGQCCPCQCHTKPITIDAETQTAISDHIDDTTDQES